MTTFLRKILTKIIAFKNQVTIKKTSTLVILLISAFSTLVLYELFFAFSKIIWSMNLNVDPGALSPQVRQWIHQHDGIEVYVLYILVFACIALTIFLIWLFNYVKTPRKKILLIFLASVFSAWFFYSKIGFYPPMPNIASGIAPFILMIFIMPILWLLIKIASSKEKLASFLISILLLPICFIATSPISPTDYSYILAPALKMLEHFEIKEIYFQYDILLSLIAALWMKLNISLNLFQILGQFSFYALFLAVFFFSKRFFIKKRLAYYLLASLVLVKVYALIHDPVLVFQATPLRLDWWILILILSFFCGIYNKLLGIALGLLLIFHRTFGLIYAIGYLEIISILFFFDFLNNNPSFQSLKIKIKKHFLLCLPNIILLILSFFIGFIILGRTSMEAASDYQQIGIGFMPISTTSFYWYFPVLASATIALLMKKMKSLPINYFNSGLLLVALSIGSSIYFFGRSHENNIINISAPLIFVLFLFLDLALPSIKIGLQSSWKKILLTLIPSLFVLFLVFFYSAGILDKGQLQFKNLLKHQNIYPMPMRLDIPKVKKFTNNSEKVYFAGAGDFYYYYYGNYTPKGHYFPYLSWVYKKEMLNFMQDLLDNGYRIVFLRQEAMIDPKPNIEIISDLRYNESIELDEFKVIWNSN